MNPTKKFLKSCQAALICGKYSQQLWLLLLSIIVTTILVPVIAVPVRSQILSPYQLGAIINQTERSWKREYEKYFDREFVNYSKTESQIAKQLSQISRETSTKPAVIWAVSTTKQLYLMLITPGKDPIIKIVRGADSQTLLKIIQLLNQTIYSSLKINSTAYLPPAQLLYKWLIAPLEADLEANEIDTLMLCSGSSLRSFPFAILHDGKHFLIEKYALVRLPAFNLTDVNYEKIQPDKLRVLAIGISKFDDRPDLPGVAAEISAIVPDIFPGKTMLDRESTVENFQFQHRQGKFNLIHLATHAEFKPGSSSNSYIEFADRKLSLNNLDRLDLSNPPVNLLVLSACDTAVGDEQAEFGFAGISLQAGVKSTLASLWEIDDLGTVALMTEFYQNLKSSLMKSQALQKAQIAAIEGKLYFPEGRLRNSRGKILLLPDLDNRKSKLSHPFYWAGFTLIGNPW